MSVQHVKNENFKQLLSSMHAAVLIIVCLMLCLSFNYTFPLHRQGTVKTFANQTLPLNIPVHYENIIDRSKKMASNIEDTFKRFKHTTVEFGKNFYEHVNNEFKNLLPKSILTEEDLHQYELNVIMKKYPYLDIKDFELKYNSPDVGKAQRQSKIADMGPDEVDNVDSGFCEPVEQGPYVEIINRGLSGFAIPQQLSRHLDSVESRIRLMTGVTEPVLKSLRNDVRDYLEKKSSKLVMP